MEIFLLLDRSNCRECGQKTCLAFAGAVFTGQKRVDECPKLDQATIERFGGEAESRNIIEQNRDEYLEKLKNGISNIDLAQAAKRIGARFSDNKLTLNILGKAFSVDANGKLFADIHINPWVSIPFLSYIIDGKGLPAPCIHWTTSRFSSSRIFGK